MKTTETERSLKLIRILLKYLDPLGMGAYHLRSARYHLLRNVGIKAHRTYPHYASSRQSSDKMAPKAMMRISHVIYR